MRGFFCLTYILLVCCFVSIGNAQNIEISGRIIDAESKEPIPFANIALKEVYKGTASNLLGDFSFKVDSLPVVLVFSHLSYERQEIEVQENEPLIIELTPGKLLMDELVIQGRGNDEYAYNLIEKAYYQVMGKGSKEKYGKAFYRQISKNGDEYSELYEIFYDTKYSNNGVEDWAIQEGRYALKLSTVDSFIYNKNFTLMVRLLTIVQPPTEDLVVPVSQQVRDQYYLITDQIISVNDRKVAQIRFEAKEYLTIPAMNGEIWIDIDSYEVMKLVGTIIDDDLNFISLKGKSGSWKNYQVSCEIAFKPLDADILAMDYIRLGQGFDYYVNGVFANHVETRSFFTYYEYYTPPRRKNLGGRLLRFNRRDSDMLDNIGYNQLFWDENIIVKRTPVEAEVIADFEEERAFGSIYLNNKDQIVLENYKMDNDPFIIQVKEQLKEIDLSRKGDKIYIHHNKPFYVTGEKMWFSAYVVNMASKVPIDHDDLMYLDLISPDGRLEQSSMFKITSGKCHGTMVIPNKLNSGTYSLRAYTDKMKFSGDHLLNPQYIEILNESDESRMMDRPVLSIDNTLKYYPEGGVIIEGLPIQLGYVSENIFGDAMDIKGKLTAQNGQLISTIKSEYNGMGSIFILPRTDIEYQTMILSDEVEVTSFPEIKKAGYSMMINNLKPNTIDISVRGTMKFEGKKFYLLVISHGILSDRRIGMLTRGLYKTEIPKSNLPNGINQILLVDEFGQIQGKRLVFINQPEAGFAKYYLAKKDFKRRERIDLVIELNDENGKPLKNADFSLSVLDRDKINRNPANQNIKTFLDLGCYVDHTIDEPGELFTDFDREGLKRFEWIMLNQRSVLPDISSFDSIPNSNYVSLSSETGTSLSGMAVVRGTREPLRHGYVTILGKIDPTAASWYVQSDENGIFELRNVTYADSLQVLVYAKTNDGNPTKIDLIFDKPITSIEKQPLKKVEMPNENEIYLKQHVRIKKELSNYNFKEQTISEQPEAKTIYDRLGDPEQTIVIQHTHASYGNLYDVFKSGISDLIISNDVEQEEILFRGVSSEPAILLDGFVLYESMGNVQETSSRFSLVQQSPKEVLKWIDPSGIERIELFGPEKISGNDFKLNSNYGIIAIYSNETKSTLFDEYGEEVTTSWVPGLAPVEIFKSPDYSKRSDEDVIPDLRTTLYWNPHVTTNRRGRAKIGFYNSDEARNFQICIEGITQDGIPIFDIYEFGRSSSRNQLY